MHLQVKNLAELQIEMKINLKSNVILLLSNQVSCELKFILIYQFIYRNNHALSKGVALFIFMYFKVFKVTFVF